MSLCAIWTKDLNLEIGRNLRKKFAEGEGIWSTSKKRNKFQINAALTISNTREIQASIQAHVGGILVPVVSK